MLPMADRVSGRSPLNFPAGATPGFDPTHPAAAGMSALHGYSAIATSANSSTTPTGVELLTGRRFTRSAGNITGGIDGVVGPYVNPAQAGGTINLSGNSTATEVGATFAFIAYVLNAGTGGREYIISNGGTGIGIQNTNTNVVFFTSASRNELSSLTLANNVPWFVAVSGNGSTLLHGVATNLNTGKVSYSTGTVLAFSPQTGNYGFGYDPTNGFPCGSNVATGMYAPSPAPMSKASLLSWAADPWSFWYPR